MKDFLYQSQWNWRASGIALGLSFLLAVAFVKPVGVSTQFVILDGIVWDLFSDSVVTENETSKTGYGSDNAYLNKSGGKYAKNIANPANYSFIFVIAMIAGGFVASKMQSTTKSDEDEAEKCCLQSLDQSTSSRYTKAFIGGVLALFGARLAGGCTSGHMMSGMMQTSLSGYLFAIGAFAAAIPVAMYVYRKGE